MTHPVTFTVPVSTEAGEEELWHVTATIYRAGSFYRFEDFEALCGSRDYCDDADFELYCIDVSGTVPDLIALACEALEREAEIDHESARGDWLYEQAKDREFDR